MLIQTNGEPIQELKDDRPIDYTCWTNTARNRPNPIWTNGIWNPYQRRRVYWNMWLSSIDWNARFLWNKFQFGEIAMIITNQEKQVLQKYYAEKIKVASQSLRDLVQQDKQDVLANRILDIHEAGQRICQIQNEWRNDNQKELAKLEQEVENGYEK